MTGTSQDSVEITVNGKTVVVADTTATLLDVLRGHGGMVSVKDGCSPRVSADVAPSSSMVSRASRA